VLVSALLTRLGGKTSLVEWLVFVALMAQRRFEMVTSDPLLHEVRDVLIRRGVSESSVDTYLDSLAQIATPVRIHGVPMGCRDPDDDMVLETAMNANADVIVSRDGDLFDPRSRWAIEKTGIGIRDRPIRVVSVRDFVDELSGAPRFSPLVVATLAA
jgi:putative PIN family toxin of toxin-antitoxin system